MAFHRRIYNLIGCREGGGGDACNHVSHGIDYDNVHGDTLKLKLELMGLKQTNKQKPTGSCVPKTQDMN